MICMLLGNKDYFIVIVIVIIVATGYLKNIYLEVLVNTDWPCPSGNIDSINLDNFPTIR